MREIQEILKEYLNQYSKARRSRHRALALFLALALVVTGVVNWGLKLDGVALTGETFCGKTEHVHTKECQEKVLACGKEETPETEPETELVLVCGQEMHVHSDGCMQQILTCGQEETPAHTHSVENGCYHEQQRLVCTAAEHTHGAECMVTEKVLTCTAPEHTHGKGCYDQEGNLICQQAEHIHGEGCYQEQQTLVCTVPEHTHGPECMVAEQILICQQPETAGHTHSESCYETQCICGKEEHVHTDACYMAQVVSQKPKKKAHVHTKDCYKTELVCVQEEHTHTLACYSNPNADLETAAVWESTLPGSLTGIWADDLITIASSQRGYQESSRNFQVEEDGTSCKGYTRYGAWYGNPYGDWCAMYVSFCLYYAGIPASVFPYDAGCQSWVNSLINIGRYSKAPGYVPRPGDLAFFKDNTGTVNHVGIVTAVNTETGILQTIEGNSGNCVQERQYGLNDGSICGYGILPENPEMVAETESETETETEIEAESETEIETETESETETETETESEMETETETESETETETESDLEENSILKVSATPSEVHLGEVIEIEIYALADDDREETYFVLNADGDNAGLDERRFDFDRDGIAVITDQNGLDIELHREYTEDGEARYWFTLSEGQSASFSLLWVNGTDRYRSEVTAEETDTEIVLEQSGNRDRGGALNITFGRGSSLEAALSQADGTIGLTWKVGASPLETPADAISGDTAETDGSSMTGANALFALPKGDAAAEAKTEDGSNSSSHDFSENITNVTVSKLENGQWIPSTEFTDGDSVRMEIHYTIPQGTVGADNQTIHYQLPDGIRLSQQEQGTVYDGQTPVGTYTITTDGLITIVFNDNYADDKPFTGQIQFQGTVSAQQGQEDTEINFGAGGTITVKPNPDPTDVRADKSGSYNEQDGKLHYTIEVTTTKGTNGTIKVTDSFQSGNTSATYDTDSFQIIKVDANGQETAINGYTPDITSGGWDGAPQQFTITDLPALQAGESYRITYTATPGKTSNINGYSDVSNYVTTTTTGGDSGSDWNQVVISQNMIGKWGNYDSAAGVINWTITINPDKRDIGGYTLTDTINANGVTAELPSTVTLAGSDGSTQTITLPYTFPAGSKDTYTITYQTKVEGLAPGESASVTNDAELTGGGNDYKAESTVWPQEQDFNSSKSYGWHDGAQDTGSTGTYQWNATITVPSSASDEALGKLAFTDTIHDLVAADGSEVEGSHYITAQQLGAMTVNVNGTALDRGTDYQICDTNGTAITDLTGDITYTGFQIRFTEAALTKIAGQTISFSYSTTVDYTKLTDGASYTIRNTGGIPDHETTPETGYNKPGQLEKQAKGFDQWGNETWLDNGASLDFEASQGVIHYRLLLHTSADTKGDLTVKDILPSGASLVEGSAYLRFYYNGYETDKIEWWDNGQQTYYADQNLTAASETSEGTTTLTFTIKDGYNNDGKANTLAIYYDVSIAKDPIWTDNPGLEEHLYTNRASWGDSKATTDVTVERDVPELKKTGAQLPQYDENGNPMKDNEGKELLSNTVRYTVTINPAAQDLDPNADVLQLVDTFGNLPNGVAGADLSIGSVKLYLYDPDAADHLGSELSNARYNYTYDSGSRVLTFTIPDSMGLVLVYDYTIDRGTAAGDLTLSNAVELTGVAGSKTEDQTHLVETSSSATVTKRTLTIYKVDGTNYGRTLPGAEFELAKFENNQWTQVKTFTSDKNGQIVFNQVGDNGEQVYQLNTLYRLTETKAPSGYAKDDTHYYFVWLANGSTEQDMEQTISDAGTSKDNVLFINDSSAIYVPNEPTTLKVQKVWTDQDGNETAPGADGVEVKLYRQATQTNAVTVTVNWSHQYGSGSSSVEVAQGSSLTLTTGIWQEVTYTVNGGNSQTVSNNTPIQLDNVTENTTVQLTVPFNPSLAFSDYTEPYHIPSGEKTLVETVTLNAKDDWSKTWENLPRADENGNPYYYTVEETKVPGYSVIYSSNNQNGIQTGQLVITNRASGYILPETGGSGTLLYTTGGLALMALAGLMYKILRRKGDEAP